MDNFCDTLKCHELFPTLCSLTYDLLQARQTVHQATGRHYRSIQRIPESHLQLDEILMHVRRAFESLQPDQVASVRRREYPTRDAILDDCHKALQVESDNIQQYIAMGMPSTDIGENVEKPLIDSIDLEPIPIRHNSKTDAEALSAFLSQVMLNDDADEELLGGELDGLGFSLGRRSSLLDTWDETVPIN